MIGLWFRRIIALTMSVWFTIAIGGCGPLQSSQTNPNDNPKTVPQPIYGVIGLDCTGSYALSSFSRAQAAKVVRTSPPESVWAARWILRDSYTDRAHLLRVPIPSMPPKPTNPFDERGRDAYRRASGQLHNTTLQAAKTIIAADPPNTSAGKDGAPNPDLVGTDIFGFFAKASELMVAAPMGYRRVVVICSDLGDTENKTVHLALKGVSVFVFFQSGGSPEEADAVRSRWRQILEEAEAQVRFVDASEDLATMVAASSPTTGR